MEFRKHKKQNKQAGFLLVEVLIVSAIMTVAALAIIAVAQKSIYVARESLHITQANFLLEEGAEATRVLRDNGWTNISSLNIGTDYYLAYSLGTWTLSTSPNTVGNFTRKVTFASVNRDATTQDIASSGSNDTGSRLVTVTVSWTEGGATINKTLSYYLMNIF
jgi:Tfp pilus assembly protein PilV